MTDEAKGTLCPTKNPSSALSPLARSSARKPEQLEDLLCYRMEQAHEILREEWFLDQLDRVGGRFNFNLEFV
jgi:hypothetical protein